MVPSWDGFHGAWSLDWFPELGARSLIAFVALSKPSW